MKRFTTLGTYEIVKVYTWTTAQYLEHLQELPTRRKRINCLNKDIKELMYSITHIARQLDKGEYWANYLGDKYSARDLRELMEDYKSASKALAIVTAAPCPAKQANQIINPNK